jgi:hypothetical protein
MKKRKNKMIKSNEKAKELEKSKVNDAGPVVDTIAFSLSIMILFIGGFFVLSYAYHLNPLEVFRTRETILVFLLVVFARALFKLTKMV